MLHLGFGEVSFGVVVETVADVAGDDGLSVEGLDGSGEWTAEMGWRVVVEKDLSELVL